MLGGDRVSLDTEEDEWMREERKVHEGGESCNVRLEEITDSDFVGFGGSFPEYQNKIHGNIKCVDVHLINLVLILSSFTIPCVYECMYCILSLPV